MSMHAVLTRRMVFAAVALAAFVVSGVAPAA